MDASPPDIRPEALGDQAAIREVEQAAFGRPTEADLVDLVRGRGHAWLSLVAWEGGRPVGHVLFTPLRLDPPRPTLRGLGLGPIAVRPDCQGRGTGTLLMEAGLARCQAAGIDFVVLLGDPRYYRRFGFLPGRTFGLSSEYGQGDEFQVRELQPGVLGAGRITVHYVPEFAEVGC